MVPETQGASGPTPSSGKKVYFSPLKRDSWENIKMDPVQWVVAMTAATVDQRGRLYLPKEVREQFGRRFRIVRLHDSVKLIPLSETPLQGLREALAPLAGEPIAAVRAEAGAAARAEALDDLR